MFDTSCLEWPPPLVIPPPEEVIDCLVEDRSGVAEPVCWSEYRPDGLLADLLAQPVQTDPEDREFEALERVGGWERVIAWARARQCREMALFVDGAEAWSKALGACGSQAHDSAVAEVGLMLTASARAAACRVGDAWSLCTRLPAALAALAALGSGWITLAKARIVDAETVSLSGEHLAAVEVRVLVKAPKQIPGQLRAAARRAVLSTDPAAVQKRAGRARRERGVQMWPEPDGLATLSAYLPAADALGVFAVLDEHARHAGFPVTSAPCKPAAVTPWSTWCSTPPATTATPPAPPATTPRSRAAGTTAPLAPPVPAPPMALTRASSRPPMPPARWAAGVRAGGAGAAAGWMSASPSPTPPCSAPMTSPVTWPVTGPSRPRWPATWPPGAPGGASSPTPPRAGPWTTAPPATAHPPTSPDS